jgi:hypothetical protein
MTGWALRGLPAAGLVLFKVIRSRSRGCRREIVLCRWHVSDPIGFFGGVRMSVRALGIGPDGQHEVRGDLLTATGH